MGEENNVDFLDTVELELTEEFSLSDEDSRPNKDKKKSTQLNARRKIEDMLEENRLQKEIEELDNINDF